MRWCVIGFVMAAACAAKARPAAVVVPRAQPAIAIVDAPPAAPAWPVPVRVLRWGTGGALEVAGELPGLARVPDEPWMAEPIAWPRDAAGWAALVDELRAHDVPGIALRERPVRGDVLAELGALPALRYVDLSGASLDAAAVARLAMEDRLLGLYLAHTGLDDATLAGVLARHPAIEVLDLDGTDAGERTAAEAARLPRLRTLTMADTRLVERDGVVLARATALQVVDLSRTAVGPATAQRLAERPLTELYLARTRVAAGARHLAPLAATLTRLDLSDQDVEDDDVAWLAAAGGLIELNLGGTKVGDATARIIAALPLVRELDLAESRIGPGGARALAALGGLERIDLAATRADDAAVAALLALPALRVLRLDDTAVGDRAFAAARPPSLRELYLARTKITDRALAVLDHTPGLIALGVRRTRITDASIARIARLTALHTLDVGELDVSADRLADLAPLVALERLYLDKTRSGDATIAAIARARLRVLHAADTMVSDASLDALAAMPLEELAVGESQLTAELTARVEAWPRLAVLSLAGLPIDDAAAARLLVARNLRVLDLSATELDDPSPLAGLDRLETLGLSQRMIGTAGIRAIAGLPRLRELVVSQCGLRDDVLPVLAGMRALRKLDLRWNPVTLAAARRALPHIELEK